MPLNPLPVAGGVSRNDRLSASLMNALNERLQYLERLFQRQHDAQGRHDLLEVPRLVMNVFDDFTTFPTTGPPTHCDIGADTSGMEKLCADVRLNNPVDDPNRYGPSLGALVLRVQSNSDRWTTGPCGAHYYQRGEQFFSVGAWYLYMGGGGVQYAGDDDFPAALTIGVHVGRRREAASGPPARRDDIARAKRHLAPTQASWDAFARHLDATWLAVKKEHDSDGEHSLVYEHPYGYARVWSAGATCGIRASRNVTSVERLSAGHYRVVCPVSRYDGSVFVSADPITYGTSGGAPVYVLAGVPRSSMDWSTGTFDVYIWDTACQATDASFGFTYHVVPS